MQLKPALLIPSTGTGRRLLYASVTVIVLVAVMALVVPLAFADNPGFPDVLSTHPYYAAITDLASRGIVGGYSDGTFGPGKAVIRQQFAKMIVLTAGYPVSESDVCPFTDVEISDATTLYPDNYIAVCAAHEVTVGVTATTFAPYANITRYQVISMVVRAADDLRSGLLATPPPDWVGSAGWENDPIHGANAARAEYNGLLDGLDLSALNPYGNMNRGEVAQVLHNLLTKLTPATTTTATSTTTTEATTTTTSASTTTTTTGGGGGGTTTTTLNPANATTDYAIAGLEQVTVTVQVLDQFGHGMPNRQVYLTSTALEGSGLNVLSNQAIGKTDADGYVAYTWGQPAGAWGVEKVAASLTGGALLGDKAVIQWIYDDRGTDYIGAVSGQQKVTVFSGYNLWNGLVLKAYKNRGEAALGSGTYVSSVNLSMSTTSHTWASGEAFYVGAVSSNIDGRPNWMYNVVP